MQESTKIMKSKIEVFNEKHPVGASVVVVKDNGDKVKTTVKHPARILCGQVAVVWLDGLIGVYALNRIVG